MLSLDFALEDLDLPQRRETTRRADEAKNLYLAKFWDRLKAIEQ